ncbi:MAG: ComEC/Rec2 family competence protein [Acidimicrobiia bacterium]
MSRPWIICACLTWLVVALTGPSAEPMIAGGSFEGDVQLLSDVFSGTFGHWGIGRADQTVVLVEFPRAVSASRGDTVTVGGRLGGNPGRAAGRSYSSELDVSEIGGVTVSRFLPHRAGKWLREGVDRRLAPYNGARGLLAGFLIGDTSHVPRLDIEAMRRSGLAHFVAVSGSNVTLYLGFLAVIAGPLAWGPKRRALLGLIALPAYVAATRFEPSVLRAAVMAAIALGARLFGIVFEAWQMLSIAVIVLILADAGLVENIGFQLSVVATAGVIAGARWPTRGIIRRALAVTAGAQVAVAPLLLVHFGSVPLMSPVVNLVAAPLVTAATLLGAVSVAGLTPVLPVATALAHAVLALARAASGWPQLDLSGLIVIAVGAGVWAWRPSSRSLLAFPAAMALAWSLIAPQSTVPVGGVAVLDVGQGDAILLNGGEGHYALVDGGPDPVVLLDRLDAYGVTHIELVVLTHVHADHAAGLVGLFGNVGVGALWTSTGTHHTPASSELLATAGAWRVHAMVPEPGDRWPLGRLQLFVDGPVRHYASANDESIVLTVEGLSRSMLLSGDIETFAQADLDDARADILKVPHHGGATSDPDWLEAVGAGTAVISVGADNDFGHPADWVIEVLGDSGSTVLRTDQIGDVVLDLG